MDASSEDRKGWEGVNLPPGSAFQPFILFSARVLFPICTLTWRANNYVSRQRKSMSRRGESTEDTIVVANTEIRFSHFFRPTTIF